ncbi:MAG: dipicolinate synthase subunit B [Clostridia bacterium]|nr:dipicolinate synthase subunit B [Clostridia bacterium]
MAVNGKKIGFAITGSHCTIDEIIPQVERLVQAGAEIYPILSLAVDSTDTRFGTAQKWKEAIKKYTKQPIITTIVGAEPIGPQKILDVLVVAPCTGNTVAKLANGITDTPVLMAIKANLRNQRPVILAVSTNDGLSMNAKNIGLLLNTKNIFMVPFGQDNPHGKPNSLVADMSKILETIEVALEGKQIQPLLVAK